MLRHPAYAPAAGERRAFFSAAPCSRHNTDRIDFRNRSSSRQRHGAFQFIAQNRYHALHAFCPASGQSINIRPSDKHSLCAQRQRHQHICSATNATIEHDRDAASHSFHHARQSVNGCRNCIQVAAAVIGNDHAIRAALHRTPAIFR